MKTALRFLILVVLTLSAQTSFAQKRCEDVFSNNDTRRLLHMNTIALVKASGAFIGKGFMKTATDKTIEKFEDFCRERNVSPARGINELTFLVYSMKQAGLKEFEYRNIDADALLSDAIDVGRQVKAFEMKREDLQDLLEEAKIFQARSTKITGSESVDQSGRYGGVASIALYATIKYPSAATSLAAMKAGRTQLKDSELTLQTLEIVSTTLTSDGSRQQNFIKNLDVKNLKFN